jgi:bacteriochlorophyll 4-vinyl reductase
LPPGHARAKFGLLFRWKRVIPKPTFPMDASRGGAAARRAGPDTPSITPVFPLLLLETMRDMDRPDEVLEGEDLAVSMPRRLGLSDVIFTQIHRFREEVKRKRLQTPTAVADLIRLVIRRPDAEEIFEEAGRRVALRAWEARSPGYRRTVGLLPQRLRRRSAVKAVRRLFRQIAGGMQVEVGGRPLALRIHDSVTVSGDPGGAACHFYRGAFAETLTRWVGKPHDAPHVRCSAQGADLCEWHAAPVEG